MHLLTKKYGTLALKRLRYLPYMHLQIKKKFSVSLLVFCTIFTKATIRPLFELTNGQLHYTLNFNLGNEKGINQHI